MSKCRTWLIINSILFTLFVYLYLGIYCCGDLPLLYSSRSGWLFGCGLLYLALLLYFSIFWILTTSIGLLYLWRKGKLKTTITISLSFLILSVLLFFSVPTYNSISKALGSYKNAERLRLEEIRNTATESNYMIEGCKDFLNEDGVINLKCNVSVGLAGKYAVKGKLFKNNPNLTGYDEIVLESYPNVFEINKDTTISIPFQYRHISRNKTIPNGPYVIELIFIPQEVLKNRFNSYTFSGFEDVAGRKGVEYKESLVTNTYEGSDFEELPYKDIHIF